MNSFKWGDLTNAHIGLKGILYPPHGVAGMPKYGIVTQKSPMKVVHFVTNNDEVEYPAKDAMFVVDLNSLPQIFVPSGGMMMCIGFGMWAYVQQEPETKERRTADKIKGGVLDTHLLDSTRNYAWNIQTKEWIRNRPTDSVEETEPLVATGDPELKRLLDEDETYIDRMVDAIKGSDYWTGVKRVEGVATGDRRLTPRFIENTINQALQDGEEVSITAGDVRISGVPVQQYILRGDYLEDTMNTYAAQDAAATEKLYDEIKRKPNVRQRILDTANSLVNGDRNVQYGDPNADFSRTAQMWNAYLEGVGDRQAQEGAAGLTIEAHDIAVMMTLLKISRLAWTPNKADSWVDATGYLACGADCVEGQFEGGLKW